MAKSKKRKKLTKRARQAVSERAGAASQARATTPSVPPAKSAPPPKPAPHAPELTHPSSVAGRPAPDAPGKPKTTVSFRDASAARGPDGIDKEITETEYPAIRRDLRKLGLTFLFFFAIIGGLTVVGGETTLIGDLGSALFKLWQ